MIYVEQCRLLHKAVWDSMCDLFLLWEGTNTLPPFFPSSEHFFMSDQLPQEPQGRQLFKCLLEIQTDGIKQICAANVLLICQRTLVDKWNTASLYKNHVDSSSLYHIYPDVYKFHCLLLFLLFESVQGISSEYWRSALQFCLKTGIRTVSNKFSSGFSGLSVREMN